jgi:hypothetical protein
VEREAPHHYAVSCLGISVTERLRCVTNFSAHKIKNLYVAHVCHKTITALCNHKRLQCSMAVDTMHALHKDTAMRA